MQSTTAEQLEANAAHEEAFTHRLRQVAAELADSLQNERFGEAGLLINQLFIERERQIFNSVGRLTRALHNAIVNFNVDVQPADRTLTEPPSEIRDASDRLQYVIELTRSAANVTLDRVEHAAPIASELKHRAKAFQADWIKLRRRELSREEFQQLYVRMSEFLDMVGPSADVLNENLQAILLEQGYQDLTGQVLNKVIGLITDVESELVNLMRLATHVDEVTGLAQPAAAASANPELEGPQIRAGRGDVAYSQDDVDDLLSSLGF